MWTNTILTRGSEFLMDWISWSRTWATMRTTTTSRKFWNVARRFCVENRRTNIRTIGRQCSFCRWILGTKTTRILIRSIWMNRVMHNTCTKHGRNIKILCIGSTSTVLWGEDWSSDVIERHHLSRNTPSILYPEGCQNGNWRYHVRKSKRVTSTASIDFFVRQLDEGILITSCWTSRWRLPTEPTKDTPIQFTSHGDMFR